ncbi:MULTISPECIES: hypothetical protein [Planktothricoides]|uniref:Uncharacterized protein n=1 Tax=Planktothricoides raciborskii FACHB-1370 TaxID=2949576 RepID=A0ABR8ECI5_9CYAN|nr:MULTISPECIES: hypothetical protein [Planktothricoides]MBD2543854.1 hypothetical protein [Planktothricoides raciborskii FACHB-1370]MBD2583135.1 hypothetical protein [Planktothricoides raciborskii FACHB-1261]
MIFKPVSRETGKLTEGAIAFISILAMQMFSQMFSQSICAQELGQFVQFAPPDPPNVETPTRGETSRESLEQEWLLPLPPKVDVTVPQQVQGVGSQRRVAPSSSILSPTAFTARWGQAFTGAGFQERTRFTDSSDGAISTGFGVGDPRKNVAFQTTITVLDLFSNRDYDDGFMKRGSFSFKAGRILANNWMVAVGIENAIVWGFTDAGTSVYGVASRTFNLKESTAEPLSRLTVSLGLGNGRFRTEDDFNDDTNTVNVFGSVGLRIAQPVSAIADWSGQDLSLGFSVVPLPNIPLVISPAFTDITGSAGDGVRFRVGVGYSYFF